VQAAAKAAILAECDRLTEAEITFVALRRRSAGDEGVSEDIKCYATWMNRWVALGMALSQLRLRRQQELRMASAPKNLPRHAFRDRN